MKRFALAAAIVAGGFWFSTNPAVAQQPPAPPPAPQAPPTDSSAARAVPAQEPSATPAQIIEAQKVNRAALAQFTWKMRADIRVSGESKGSRLFQASFDSTGRPQLMAADTGKAEEGRGGLRGKRDKKQAKELGEKVSAAINLSRSYATMTTGQIVDFFEKGTVGPGTSDMVGTTMAQGRNVFQPGDQVSMWFDPQTKQLRRMTFTSALEKAEVSGTVTFTALANGPTYPQKSVITMPSEHIEVTVESSDFVNKNTVPKQ